ncbi:restriction endonuclease subunit M [Pseudomonas aeruginosa]|uniref:Eco57I restriction-modification methylase domain-containing protein n=1 Tax=Pseudomonas aeruginosa TaxID=287 RepID=UPI0009AA3165|nr:MULTISPECIES: restriction endonuclease subunit M [Pseudomonas]AQZ33458.1 restriction endonuclease subunit M [Pseudomonas sp. LPH1]MBG4395802.1 SAM-dependent DNA methyltransferase [Pseudomonas aeruginosa]MBX6579694.1 SAM-dependent DNA methyltransferase [Pseudomonas aeruginosa]MBX6627563.1 SAM-dependent DNA methyltransferase [Pseudomonas aeruginosa]MBZ5230979.1 SAM-dependent DNA methyltransferase [Pseudomonas aeruginosa]
MREFLDKKLRKQLETTVIKARDIAEQAAQEALTRLSVGDASAASYLDDEQRALRNRLRAHGRQLGDLRDARTGQQETQRLCVEIAYEHWHRMLFARFLEQNHLLMYDPHTALTLEECQELAADEGCANGWELAGKLASRMLPQVFRADSPALAVPLAFNHVRALEKLIADLDKATFQAADSLGWVYQYWQAKKKDEVNASGVKIGADELSPVTQLFTEPYMVQFLLDNSLGAWWVTHYPQHRDLLPLTYLRTVPASAEDDSTANAQVPAAGTFDGWPQNLAQFKMLDPCCGSGHFLVATLLMLVPMRMAAEGLPADQAIDAVISQNLHGLELDQRCVELAAFAVALEAWRYQGTSGYRSLPALRIACVGQRIQTPREQWLALAGDNPELKAGMTRLYDTFRDAPILGSLIDPARSLKGDLLTADWRQVQPLLSQAFAVGEAGETDLHEAAIVARGLAQAADLLSQRYQLVITNVPYLARGKQSEILRDFCERYYDLAKNDLANVFLERCLELTTAKGAVQVVMPQNWLFLTSYRKQREHLLKAVSWNMLARLGAGAFDTINGEVVNVILLTQTCTKPAEDFQLCGLDASVARTVQAKAEELRSGGLVSLAQKTQMDNPNCAVSLEDLGGLKRLGEYAYVRGGITTGDSPRYRKVFWDVCLSEKWSYQQSTVSVTEEFSGRENVLLWDEGRGALVHAADNYGATIAGRDAWGRTGIAITYTGALSCTIYNGHLFENVICVLIPKDEAYLLPIWQFCSSKEFSQVVRGVNQKLSVDVRYFESAPFDLAYWGRVTAERYPNGLPKPYSDNPTQWIFHGHPTPATEPLQVAVARLLGYRWPAESDAEMELSDEARAWIARCANLNVLADDDGIVCLSPLRGEKAADDRLESLLQAAFGADWTPQRRNQLLEQVGAKKLDAWLRDKFFEQHCKLFHHRPFIWQIWDGLKDGFSALVNYHKLDRNNLERLIYTYLDTWISNQQRAASEKVDGADARLAAAQDLKARLVRILEGEAPYDIFVRWKPLEQQPIGWNPDLNDGVRLNIRPFMTAEVLRHNKKPKLNIEWKKDRGNDVPSAPWYTLGLEYGEKEGARINDHHLTLAEKKAAQK